MSSAQNLLVRNSPLEQINIENVPTSKNDDLQGYAEADYQFHLQIALATHNKYFEDFYRHLGTSTIPRTRLDTSRFSPEPGRLMRRMRAGW